jgi:glycosyltransferase involved in cell wall biosynthesis
MDKVVSENVDVNLLIIGNGPTMEIAGKMIKSLYLEKNIKIIPRVKHSEIKMYYMASDLFILPSYSEGLPKVVLEAMACGTPVVASNIPGHKDVINNNMTGYLFKTGDVEDLSSKIIKALGDREKRSKLAYAAKTFVQKQCTWDCVSKRLDHVYEGVLKERI